MTDIALKRRAILMMVKMGVADAGAGANVPQITIEDIEFPGGKLDTHQLGAHIVEGIKWQRPLLGALVGPEYRNVMKQEPVISKLPQIGSTSTIKITGEQLPHMLRVVGAYGDTDVLQELQREAKERGQFDIDKLVDEYNKIITRNQNKFKGVATIQLSDQAKENIRKQLEGAKEQAAAHAKPVYGGFDPNKIGDAVINDVMNELKDVQSSPELVGPYFKDRINKLQLEIQNALNKNPNQIPYDMMAKIVLYQQLANFQGNEIPDENRLRAALDTNDDGYISAKEWRIAYNNVGRSLGLPRLDNPNVWTWFTEFFGDLPTIQKVALVAGIPLSLIGIVGTVIDGPDIMSLLVFGLGLAGIIWPLYASGTLSQVIGYLAGLG